MWRENNEDPVAYFSGFASWIRNSEEGHFRFLGVNRGIMLMILSTLRGWGGCRRERCGCCWWWRRWRIAPGWCISRSMGVERCNRCVRSVSGLGFSTLLTKLKCCQSLGFRAIRVDEDVVFDIWIRALSENPSIFLEFPLQFDYPGVRWARAEPCPAFLHREGDRKSLSSMEHSSSGSEIAMSDLWVRRLSLVWNHWQRCCSFSDPWTSCPNELPSLYSRCWASRTDLQQPVHTTEPV